MKKPEVIERSTDYIKKFIDHLGESLVADLKQSIPKQLETLIDIRFQGIKDGLEPLKDINATLINQGNDIENLQLSYKHLNDEFEAFRKRSQNLPQEVKETIENSLEVGQNQIVDVIAGQLEQTPTKPSKPVEQRKKRKWFLFF